MVGVPSAAVSGQWFVATRRGRAHRDSLASVCLRSGEVEATIKTNSRPALSYCGALLDWNTENACVRDPNSARDDH